MRRIHAWICIAALLAAMFPAEVFALDTAGAASSCETAIDVTNLESTHDYAADTDETWTVEAPGATHIALTFDERTETESGYDFIEVTDGNGTILGRYSGTDLAGKTVRFDGDTLTIRLKANGTEQYWGFKVTAAAGDTHQWQSEEVPHSVDAAGELVPGKIIYTCSVCGTVREEPSADDHHDWQEAGTSPHSMDADGALIPGTTRYTCPACGAEKEESNKDDHHDWQKTGSVPHSVDGEGNVVPGSDVYTCSVCGATEERENDDTKHVWAEKSRTEAVIHDDGTTEAGSVTYACSICGEERTETVTAELVEETDAYALYTDGTLVVKSNDCVLYPTSAETTDEQKAHMEEVRNQVRRLVFEDDVTELQDFAFTRCKNLKSVKLPGTITRMGNSIFMECTGLEYAALPGTITEMGVNIFMRCMALKKAELGYGITEVPDSMFTNCYVLEEVSVPDTVTKISSRAFSGCRNLQPFELPPHIAELGSYCFQDCDQFIEFTVPEGITKLIGTFSGCDNLESVTLPMTLESLGGAFSGCSLLKRVDLPAGLKSFSGSDRCKQLEELVLPEGLEYLGSVGSGCPLITSIKVPASVQRVGWMAFCSNSLRRVFFFGAPVFESNWEGTQASFSMVKADVFYDPANSPERKQYHGTLNWIAMGDAIKADPDAFVAVLDALWAERAALDSEDYRTDQWKEIETIYAEAVQKIADAASPAEAAPIVADARERIAAVKTAEEVSKLYDTAPVITKTRNLNAGTEVTWTPVEGAIGYELYFRTRDGASWRQYGKTLTATTYTVHKSSLKEGNKMQYAVKAVYPEITSKYSEIKYQTWIPAPAVTKTKNLNAGVQVTWNAVKSAETYTVMYKVSGGSWKTAKSGITGTSYTVPKNLLKSGTKYYFTVKAKGAATSGYTSGKAQTYLAAPAVKSASKTSSGIKVTWGKVTGATTYTVMMKVSGGDWTTVKTGVTGTSYTVPASKLTGGKTYYFTVKAKGAATSGYSSGKSVKY